MILRKARMNFQILFVLLLGLSAAISKEDDNVKSTLRKIATNDHYATILINNFSNYYSNNGDGSYDPFNYICGLEYPKGSGKTASFEDGLVWGCSLNGERKIGGSAYRHGLQAGPIITAGTAAIKPVASNPTDARYRLYRVRPDINPSTTFEDVQKILVEEEVPLIGRFKNVTASSLFDQYVKDWNEWPADQGAPFKDVNGNGVYDPTVDIPGIPGADQTLWHVSNDLDTNRQFFNNQSLVPVGIEFQRTIWAYNKTGALANSIFIRSRIINKSGMRIDSMYIAEWADTDLGDASDDRVGCDTVRNMGYVYNGRPIDSYYGTRVPALGYILLQGPLCPGTPTDSAVVNFHYRTGYRNLKMTAFDAGQKNSLSNPDANSVTTWFNIFNGRTSPGEKVINPMTGAETKFWFPGDPVQGTGWISSMLLRPMDARFTMTSGPFTMERGDTQDVVIALCIAQAGDYLSSISYLRSFADEVWTTYNSQFKIPRPISPIVSASSLDEEVVLSWSDSVRTAEIEAFDQAGYKFEGYNVYALPGPEFQNAIRLATYDRVDAIGPVRDIIFDESQNDIIEATVQWGTDGGIRRHYETMTDALTNHFIRNYSTYYFAVSSYYVTTQQDARPKSLESEPTIVSVTPMPPKSGVRFGSRYGDTISVQHTSGKSEVSVVTLAIDPTKITGHAYKVLFDTTGDQVTWSLQDTTAVPPREVLSHQTNLSGSSDYKIIDGIQVRVIGASQQGMKDYTVTGTRRWTWTGADGLHLEGFMGAIGWNEPSFLFHVNAIRTVTAGNLKRVQQKIAAAFSDTAKNGFNYYAGWNQNSITDQNFSYGYRYVIGGTNPARPEFAPYLIGHTQGSWGFVDYKKAAVPFSAWDMETTPPTRLAVGFTENNTAGGLVDGRYWPPLTGAGQTNTDSLGPQEWFFIFNKPYTDAVPDPSLQKNILTHAMPIMWMGTVERRNSTDFPGGDEFDIIPFRSPGIQDVFVFQTPATTATTENTLKDVERINVFPNPYFAGNIDEPNKYTRFVTISHLPRKANIRIFTLGGYLVRTIVKNDDLPSVRWDLMNGSSSWVASGIYIIHVDMPDLGKTKFLKLAVIQQVFVPDNY